MPTRRRKRLTGIGVVVGAMSPIRPNVIWALDFQFDITADGRTLKMLDVIDEFTRECPAIEVDRIIDADHVVAVLDRLALARGAPTYVRFDIHSESRVDRPRLTMANAWIESFDGRLRDGRLNSWRLDSLLEARVITEDWRLGYNANRPSLGVRELSRAVA